MLTQAELAWLTPELTALLTDATIQRIYEPREPHQWVFQLRRPGQTTLLAIDVHPEQAHLRTLEKKPKQPQHPTPLTMLLRKWLQGALITEVIAPESERLLILTLTARAPREDSEGRQDEEDQQDTPTERVTRSLVIELTGRHANLVLLDEAQRVMALARRDTMGERRLRAGSLYERPPLLDEEPERARHNRFLSRQDEDTPSTRLAAVGAWFEQELSQARQETVRDRLAARLTRNRKRLTRLIKNLEGDLERVEEASQWRRFGELLQSAHGQVARGASMARVPDYYAEGMPEVEIPLDPTRSLKENIAKYFKQYKRLHDATPIIEGRLLEAMEQLEEVSAAREELRGESAPQTLGAWEELEEHLEQRGLLGAPKQQPASVRGPSLKSRPFRQYTGSKGSVILVGKGARGNDQVSLKEARGRDIWLHARDWAGAHVVLRMSKEGAPDQAELLDAAMLAAHHSKGRHDTVIDVTYTQAKYIRKPKGYPLGMVTVAGGSTLAVRLDEGRLAKVLATEQ